MSHNNGSRVTIIYYGLGAYTFALKYNVYDAYLMYHIPNSDAQFVKLDQYVYVQGNIKVLVRDEEDAEPGAEVQAPHAQNVVTTYLTLYQVTE